ncbi:uncharacterized protein N0V89_009286 [Didymosphaeria variabile]|uniref:Uncharacterized protein n=1 Tax=Didymosphaeria variabile TaxID=1932322 RepID=A0A9W8XE25_9PLEO|nr:uncharacterized protein N0V89_009286 [Didymosphaeria variabile]KAJ4347914.1 hypothetical protein N0V89_009286 [Didymosphaeria variabile]
MSVAAADGLNDIYESLEQYNWDDDAEFQSGLNAILGNNSSPEQASELALRARCFYYARKYNINVDFDAYKAYRSSRGRPALVPNGAQAPPTTSSTDDAGGILPVASANANEPPAPYPTSFAHIVELVTTGQPIPGIKEIPDTLLTGQSSEATKSKRRKPWEKDESTTSGEAAAEATTTS